MEKILDQIPDQSSKDKQVDTWYTQLGCPTDFSDPYYKSQAFQDLCVEQFAITSGEALLLDVPHKKTITVSGLPIKSELWTQDFTYAPWKSSEVLDNGLLTKEKPIDLKGWDIPLADLKRDIPFGNTYGKCNVRKIDSSVHKDVNMPKANWKFDESVAPVFDEHVRLSVPMYDEMHQLVADMSTWFVEEKTNVYDIGTSTGQAIKNIRNQNKGKSVNYIGIDSSEEMIKVFNRNQSWGSDDVKAIHGDVLSPNIEIHNGSFITAIFTAQFISPEKRRKLFDKIYAGLNEGGAFVLVEKIVGNNARFNEMWIELHQELKAKNGISESEIFRKARSIRGVMRPNTVEENINLMRNCGFKSVDLFLKWCNFAGFIGVKS